MASPPAARRRRRPLTRLALWIGGVSVLILTLLMIDVWPALGTRASGSRLQRIRESPQFNEGRFRNTLPRLSDGFSFATAREYFTGGSAHRQPGEPLLVESRKATDFAQPAKKLRVTWLGHSTFLVEIDGTRILVDPVWGKRASPSRFVGTARFYAPPLALEDLPPLDAVAISHDHYDHLDLPTVRALADLVPKWLVPLGIGAHLEGWGIPKERIEELDWWDETIVGKVRMVSTPARHFSGRSVNDRDATLWTGWAIIGDTRRIWYSGDTALTPQFNDVGRRLGPFDLTLIESGAYSSAWTDVHLGPEQAVQAHRMVGGGLMVPVHWGLFDLALHGWTEPAERVRAAAQAAGIEVALPRPGQSLTLDDYPTEVWWPELPWQTSDEAPIVSTGLLARPSPPPAK